MGNAKDPPKGLPPMADKIKIKAPPKKKIQWSRIIFILLGFGLFCLFNFMPSLPDAIDPKGKHFVLTHEAQAAIGIFLLAGVWWVFEVIPIGATSIAIAIAQALILPKEATETCARQISTAFTDFMDPSVWFIFGSIVIGMVFTKTGLTKRMAYKMLMLVGEKTSMIYLGSFIMTAALTLIMAHTAVAATIFPLLMAIHSLYSEEDKPTKFGKGMFIGMAYVAGAGSIITLLGAARGAVAIGFFKDIVGREIGFFELTKFMLPLGAAMVALLWVMIMVFFKPEKKTIPGLRERASGLYLKLGPITVHEIAALLIVLTTILLLSLRAFVPALKAIDKSAIILMSTLLFFVLHILTIEDLESIPWNIILLFGGAMSIGYCLWQTGAANWIAVNWLLMFQKAPAIVFILAIAFFVLVMTNFIMNVAAIAISLPVALVIAPYLNVAPEVIFYAALAAAGMPFILLVGAAPNAIAYGSKQFTTGEFFITGVPASLLLIFVLWVFVKVVWPLMGMPVMLH